MPDKKLKGPLEQRVLSFIRENCLLAAGSKVLVAVSGGPDSVTLLDLLYRLQNELVITLHIAHLNHQLRGAESEADASYVKDLAAKLDLPATIETGDVSGYQAERRLSLEEAAREVRYTFLAQTARKVGANMVAVGHTLNDQVETVLLHIIRGTGTRGLRGLQPVTRLKFGSQGLTLIRPLLEIPREETEAYCAERNIVPCQDSTNLSLSPLRNRVRRELLPLLKGYNPGIFESLLRTSRIARDDLAFLEAEVTRSWAGMVSRQNENLIIDKTRFQSLAPAIQRQVLREGIEGLLGTLKDIETRHIEEILEALKKPAGRQISLPEGLIFAIDYNHYLLGFNPSATVPFPEIKADYSIRIPGQTRIPGWQIEVTSESPESFADEDMEAWNEDGFTAYFDQDKVGDKVNLRSRLPGDVFQPLKTDYLKKVGEFMVDARVPRAWRPRIPILYTLRQIIWIGGWRIDDRVKVTPETRHILKIRLNRD